MFFKIWSLRKRTNENLLAALRFGDVFMGFALLVIVLSGQSFIEPYQAIHLFIGQLFLLAVKIYFEKKSNYETVYLAFTLQFVTHLFLHELPRLSTCIEWFLVFITSHEVSIFSKFVILYMTTYLILLPLLGVLYFYSYLEEQFIKIKSALEIRRLVKKYPYQSVEEIKIELYKQSDFNDFLITPFVFLIPAINTGVIDGNNPVIADLADIVKKLSIFSSPDSLSESNIHSLLDVINFFWGNKKEADK